MYRVSSAWNLRFFFTLDVVVTLYDNDVEMIHPSNCIHFNYVISFQVKDIVLQKLIYEYEDDLLLSSGHTAFFSRRGEEDGIDHGCMLLSCDVSKACRISTTRFNACTMCPNTSSTSWTGSANEPLLSSCNSHAPCDILRCDT